jgi:hypothetical protein
MITIPLYLQTLIESARIGAFAVPDETTSYAVHQEQLKAFLLPCENTSSSLQTLHRSPKLIFYPDPASQLDEVQVEDAVQKALQLYSWDESFGPPHVRRCPAPNFVHHILEFRPQVFSRLEVDSGEMLRRPHILDGFEPRDGGAFTIRWWCPPEM